MSDVLLALDTSTDVCALALGEFDGGHVRVIDEFDFAAPRAALGRLVPAIVEALAAHSLAPDDISGVVVGRGPGSFTGVRIGVATAKGIAYGRGVPLYGVGTLDAVAWRALPRTGLLGVVGDAMRGEVYPTLFELSGGGVRRRSDDYVASPRQVAREWARQYGGVGLCVAGNGLRKYRDIFAEELGGSGCVLPEDVWFPSGAGVLQAFEDALVRDAAGDGDPGSLLPIYTRLSDAEESERARSSSANGAVPGSGVGGDPNGADTPREGGGA